MNAFLKPSLMAMALAAAAAQPLHAGGMADPIVEPETITKDTAASSAGGYLVPLLLLVLIAAVAGSGGADAAVK